ncbi:MAG: orotate phosphoribosyltransferase [Actinomycetota bacterium]
MDRNALGRALAQACTLTGEFVLRSGQISNRYFDKYRFEADPALLEAVASHLAPLIPANTEVLAGLETGGIPIAVALSLTTRLPAAFVRKQAKTYGTAKLAEGTSIEGRQLLVIEDVVTTGGQIVASVEELRRRGAQVDQALCVIDRSGGSSPLLASAGITLNALFTEAELDEH